jgi:hypothetical protein
MGSETRDEAYEGTSGSLSRYQRRLRQQIEALNSIVADPVMLSMLKDIHQAPVPERLRVATEVANLERLRERGLAVPEGMRVTTRYFEAPQATARADILVDTTEDTAAAGSEASVGSAQAASVCVSLGFFVCASVGSSTGDDVPIFGDIDDIVRPQ